MGLTDARVGERIRWGVHVDFPTRSPIFNKRVQRAEGDGSGSPSTGTETVLTVIPGHQTRFTDRGTVETVDPQKTYIYRYRFVRPGALDGSWSDWSEEKTPAALTGQPSPERDSRAVLRGDPDSEGSASDLLHLLVQKLLDAGDTSNTILVGGHSPGRHIVPGTAQDGGSVTFSDNYDTAPKFAFVPQVGRSYVGSGTSGFGDVNQRLDMVAESLSVSGFDLRAKNIAAKNFSSQTDGFSSSRNTSAPENGDVQLGSDGETAFSNLEDANSNSATYNVFYDVSRPASPATFLLTVHVEVSDAATGGSFTEVASQTYQAGPDLTDESLDFQATLGSNYDVRIRVTVSTTETWSVTCHGEDNAEPGVQWQRDDGTTTSSMTPEANDRILYLPIDAAAP